MKRSKKVIIIAKKYFPSVLEEFRAMGIYYKFMEIGKDGKLKSNNISNEILELQASIKEAEKHVREIRGWIKKEEKDIEHERSYIRYCKKEIRKLEKKK